MQRYAFVCSLGHEPETMIVEALSDDEALEKMMILARDHIAKNHSDKPPMSEEQMMSLIKTTWNKH
jgi:hypothetical protein